MDRKIKLSLEDLKVESFTTEDRVTEMSGTVHGYVTETHGCGQTCYPDHTCVDTCNTDGESCLMSCAMCTQTGECGGTCGTTQQWGCGGTGVSDTCDHLPTCAQQSCIGCESYVGNPCSLAGQGNATCDATCAQEATCAYTGPLPGCC